MRKLGTLLMFVAVGISSCDQDSSPTDSVAEPLGFDSPLFSIVDRTNGGNPGFRWLPPIGRFLRWSELRGDFDAEIYPDLTVEICEWVDDECAESIRTFSPEDDGPDRVYKFEWLKRYVVTWNTHQDELDSDSLYRIIVRAGPVELGHADVDPFNRFWERFWIDSDEYVPVRNGRSLLIAFRVDEGAVPEADEIFVVGDGTWQHFDGSWHSQAAPVGRWNRTWGTSASSVYVVGDTDLVYNFDGTTWNPLPHSPADPHANHLDDIWGTGDDDVFAVGSPQIIQHYNGITWNVMNHPSPETLSAVWGRSGDEVYAVGRNGWALKYDGNSWTPMPGNPISSEDLAGLWGVENHLYAVGTNGTILHYDGTSWEQMDLEVPTSHTIFDIHGTSANNIFASGNAGLILRWDPDAEVWKSMPTPVSVNVMEIWVVSSEEAYAAGDAGLLKFDGASWTQIPVGDVPTFRRGLWSTTN